LMIHAKHTELNYSGLSIGFYIFSYAFNSIINLLYFVAITIISLSNVRIDKTFNQLQLENSSENISRKYVPIKHSIISLFLR